MSRAVALLAAGVLVVFGEAVGLPSAVVMSGGLFMPSLWIRFTSLPHAVSLLLPVVLVGSWMALAGYLSVRLSAPTLDSGLARLRAGLVVLLMAGIGVSVLADMVFR